MSVGQTNPGQPVSGKVRVASLGECMIELVERPDRTLTRGFGGDTLNTAVYLARLGVETDYVTALSDDPFSAEMLAAWQAEGIGTGAVARVPGKVPGLYLIQTDARGERRFSYWRDSAPVRQLFNLPDTAATEAALVGYDLLYLSGITLSLFDDAGQARLFDTLDRLRAHGGRVVFDTNFRPRGWPDRARARRVYAAMFARADIVLASTEDHALLYEDPTPEGLLARLREAGVAERVAKLAEPACHVQAEGVDAVIAAEPVAEVVDTTAAGDSFSAAYVAARLAGADPIAASRVGHALAGTVIRHRGAVIPREAMPRLCLQPSGSATD
ncbi:2-dehydro-3-deoxygluconokinase [Rhodovastum atsumiense]|uniref:2-dehydro-3-deoxygluconokinase n=1 Tax=Rhodovastum atsumiense TaxID=504468 RepID=A0A5M6IUQ9_9PROT|nr:sugar kinase [Rhodovastum atsumiense]KAA5612053.1 sugar kinase [Rhodovastum atsumiense]CAH2604080.1 2-dehydro-3-deoxygluconokinase [Rhodovastum atsumiense]